MSLVMCGTGEAHCDKLKFHAVASKLLKDILEFELELYSSIQS